MEEALYYVAGASGVFCGIMCLVACYRPTNAGEPNGGNAQTALLSAAAARCDELLARAIIPRIPGRELVSDWLRCVLCVVYCLTCTRGGGDRIPASRFTSHRLEAASR